MWEAVVRFHIHWHREVWRSYAYSYRECRCGRRQAVYLLPSGYAPVDTRWLGIDPDEAFAAWGTMKPRP